MDCRCGIKMNAIMSRMDTSSYWCSECGRVVKVFRNTEKEEWYEPKVKDAPVENTESVGEDTVAMPSPKITAKDAGTTQPLRSINTWKPPTPEEA